MNFRIAVIDDFHGDPDAVRDRALRAKYADLRKSSGYNGLYSDPHPQFLKSTAAKFAQLLGRNIFYDPSLLQLGFKALFKSHQLKKVHLVHCDQCRWSGVINLSPPPLPQQATSFWQHKKFGLFGFHDDQAVLEASQRHSITVEELYAKVRRDSQDLSKWREVHRIGYAYNRLILFSGDLFHSSGLGFGTNLKNCKLTQTFFFEESRPQENRGARDWKSIAVK